MGRIYQGPAHLMDSYEKPVSIIQESLPIIAESKLIEIIKEVPVEIIKEIKVIEEKIIHVPVIEYVIKEVPVEIIKEIKIIEEKLVHVPVIEYVEKHIEVIKEIEKFVDKEIKVVPLWIKVIAIIEALLIIGLLIK